MSLADDHIMSEPKPKSGAKHFADYDKAERVANRLTSEFTVPPIPVLDIAEQNGIDVAFTDFGKFGDTVAGLCDFTTAKLHVNVNDNVGRQMFTMAHELGHWLLHREYFIAHPDMYPVLPRFQSSDKSNSFEREANAFAANLLVPKRLLSPVSGSPVSALADIFGVSKEMMEIRLKNVRF